MTKKSRKKGNSKDIPVDMNGIYTEDLDIVLNCFNNLFKKYSKNSIIEKINNDDYLQSLNKSALKHLIDYIENKNKDIFILRNKPVNSNKKSKLWSHITDYQYTLIIASSVIEH